jgi:ElaB/YqjD/DUF883 family membrane-anchored ribosome-binding protein
MDTTRDLELPSGFEVESAALHPPVVHDTAPDGFRGRLDTLKSRGLTKVHDLQRVVNERSLVVRDGAKSQVTKLQDSMRISPMTWAGIAAGSGFALGLLGRITRARYKRSHEMPTLVIVEASC